MDGPGMSLFQGAASIHLNNSAQDRLEEQEELEDQKRRNEELKHKFANAFDDLMDDDEASSVNSSGNFTMDNIQNNGPQLRVGHPPTYIESLSHLKELTSESPKYCETPNNHLPQVLCDTPKGHMAHGLCETPKGHMTHGLCESPKNHLPHGHHQEEPVKLPFSPYGAGDGQNNYLLHQELRGHMNGINSHEARQEFMNHEQLKVMYEMRVQECQHLASQVEKLDGEIEKLRARLAAAVCDRDKADLSLQEAHHLLASSKHKMIELEQQVNSLTDKLVATDQDKEQLRLELRSANVTLQDVQQRLHTLQVAHTHDTDALFREQQDRHREDMDRLQKDLMKAKSRLDEKDNEIKTLERRCKERDREKEDLLIEKGATINRLASELEAAQSRLVSAESARLKERVAKEQVKELGSKLEVTAHELVQCRSKVSASQQELEMWRSSLRQILSEAVSDNAAIGEAPSPGKLSTLRELLTRYKTQLQKIPALQEQVANRDKKLEQHRKQEAEYRAKLEEQKVVEMQLSSRLAVLQNKLEVLGGGEDGDLLDSCRRRNEQLVAELQDAKADLKTTELKYTELELELERATRDTRLTQEAHAELVREVERSGALLTEAKKENGELKNLYLQACSSRESVTRELKELTSRVQTEREQLLSRESELVQQLEAQRRLADRLHADLDAANGRVCEMQREFNGKQKDFTGKLDQYLKDEKTAMRKEMELCAQCEKHLRNVKYLDEQLSKCTVRLASQESNEALMTELRNKAEFFQQYIMDRFKKMHAQRSVGTNTEHEATEVEKECLEECQDIVTKTAMMMKEKAIRDQIAEKFTLEMKTVEMNCARKIKEIQSDHTDAITKLKELLERKAQEVETLKAFIISERNKVSQILESKESEISALIKEHNELQADCQKTKDLLLEWKVRAEKYKERASRLGSLEDVLKSEREDRKQKNTTSAREYQAMKVKVSEMQSKLSQMEEAREKMQLEWQTIQDKYRHAKKTIMTYKEYITKKDTHVNNEMNRIQDEYRKIFVKLQNQINCQLSGGGRGAERGAAAAGAGGGHHLEDVSERLRELNEEIARLAHCDLKHDHPN